MRVATDSSVPLCHLNQQGKQARHHTLNDNRKNIRKELKQVIERLAKGIWKLTVRGLKAIRMVSKAMTLDDIEAKGSKAFSESKRG